MDRMLIARVELSATQNGHPSAELYSADSRLKFPSLVLFNPALLEDVGIDPAALAAGPVHKRFWAHYELSDKLNQAGNPYKDVLELTPYGSPVPQPVPEFADLLQAVRDLRPLLVALVRALAPDAVVCDPASGEILTCPADPEPLAYADGSPVSNNSAELHAYQAYLAGHDAQPPESVDDLRTWWVATRS